jgi:spermidine/putrescine-binding protein
LYLGLNLLKPKNMKKIALALVVIAGLVSSCGKKTEEVKTIDLASLKGSTLNILAWEGYVDASFTKGFEEKYGVTVKGTYFSSSDDMLTKLKAGGGNSYDIITPSSDVSGSIVSSDLVEPIDTEQIKAWGSLSPALTSMKEVQKDGKYYAMPFTWGPEHLIYNADVIQEAPTSWDILNDPKYKGKIALYNDLPTIYLVALMLGYDKTDPAALYNLTEEQLLACKAKLLEMKPQIRKFINFESDLVTLFKNKEVVAAVGSPITVANLKKLGMNIKAVIPSEGATGWIDHLMIVKGAKNKQLALLWMDYVSEAKIMAKVAESTEYYVANPDAKGYLPTETQKRMDEAKTDDMFFIINFWQPIKDRKRYNEICREIIN